MTEKKEKPVYIDPTQKRIDNAIEKADEGRKEPEAIKTSEEIAAEKKAEEVVDKTPEEIAAEKETEELTPEQIEAKKVEEDTEKEKKIEDDRVEAEKKEGEEIVKKKAETEKEKPWWDTEAKKEEPKKEKKEVTTEPDKDSQAKAAKYDSLLENPATKAFIEAIESGNGVASLLSELKGVDPNSMSLEALYKMDLEGEKITGDAFDIEMERFADMSPMQQRKATREIKERLLKDQEERISKFSTDNTAEIQATEDRTRVINEKADIDIAAFIKEYEGGKEFYGVKMTPEILKDMEATVSGTGFGLINEDGIYNIDRLMELALWRNHKSTIMSENIEKATAAATKAQLDEHSRVSVDEKGTQRLQGKDKPNKSIKDAELLAKSYNPTYGNAEPVNHT